MVRFGLRQHPSEISVKVSSRYDLFLLFFLVRYSVDIVWFGLVWLGFILRQHLSEASVKVSSRSDLFWQF